MLPDNSSNNNNIISIVGDCDDTADSIRKRKDPQGIMMMRLDSNSSSGVCPDATSFSSLDDGDNNKYLSHSRFIKDHRRMTNHKKWKNLLSSSNKDSRRAKLLTRRIKIRMVLLSMMILWVTDSMFDLSFYKEELRRRLKAACKLNTPFVRVQDVTGWMPPIVDPLDRDKPSHLALCEAFLERIDDETTTKSNNGKGTQRKRLLQGNSGNMGQGVITVTEDPATCTDWTAPHYSLMEMYSSSLIAAVGKDLKLNYRHGCHRSRGSYKFKRGNDKGEIEEILTHWDFTTIQQLMVENMVSHADADKIDPDTVKGLCQGCIAFHQNGAPPQSYSSISHHCMLFPGVVRTENQLVLKTILNSEINRLQKASQDWLQHSSPLVDEENSGVIILLDDTSSLLHYTVYDANIPERVSTIQIFITANCARASVAHGNNCVEHGRKIKRFFMQTRGLYSNTYVRIDVVASTAAAFSRMINVKTLICPPGSLTCLLPAVAKNPGTNAVIVEAESHPVTYNWFKAVQEDMKDTISVVNVNDDLLYMPPELIGEARGNINVAEAETKEEERMTSMAPENIRNDGLLALTNADTLAFPITMKKSSSSTSLTTTTTSESEETTEPPTNEPTSEPTPNPGTEEEHLSADQVLDLITETASTDNIDIEMAQNAPDDIDLSIGKRDSE